MGGCAARENLLLHALLQEPRAVSDALELSSCDEFSLLAIVVEEHMCGNHVEQIAKGTTKGRARKHTNMPKAFSLLLRQGICYMRYIEEYIYNYWVIRSRR